MKKNDSKDEEDRKEQVINEGETEFYKLRMEQEEKAENN